MLNKFPDPTHEQPEVTKPTKLNKVETAETKEELELKIQKELAKQGKSSGINFDFPKPRFRLGPDKLYSELNWDYFSPQITETEKEELNFCFQRLVEYLDSPIITDDFTDHNARRDWENGNLKKNSPEAEAYYEHNRLGLNFASSLNKMINILNLEFENNTFINRDVIYKLNTFLDLLPEELKDGSGENYANLTTEEKITLCDELAPLVAATIRTIGRAKLTQVN